MATVSVSTARTLRGAGTTRRGRPPRPARRFVVGDGETLAGLLAHSEEVLRRTDELVRTRPDLDVAQPLSAAPWFEPGATPGSLDGQKTMG